MARRLAIRLALLLALTALLWRSLSDDSGPATAADDALPEELVGEPDLYLEGARIRQFTETGRLSYELRSQRIRHFENDVITRLEAPRLALHAEREAGDNLQAAADSPWIGTAGKGFIDRVAASAGGFEERVYLTRDVKLEQRLASGRFIRLRTEHLYLFPEREYAQTEHSVTIDTDGGRTKAGSMMASLSDGLIDLRANAEQRVNTIILRDQFK